MKTRYLALFRALVLLGLLASGVAVAAPAKRPAADSPEFPRYVMEHIDDLYRGQKSHSKMVMKVKTAHWSRSMSLESWSLGKDYSLVRILKPNKERGTATLKAKSDLFIYLNKTSRTIKITSGMMGSAWMGSHFTNDDLMRDSRLSRDYQIKLASQGQAQGQPVYRFSLQAKPDAVVVWDKLLVVVRQADLQPLREEFYDESGKKVRVLEFANHQQRGGRTLPLQMTMKVMDKPGEQTTVTLEKIDFSVQLSPRFFTLQKLKAL